jgi:hypothetical protein
MLTLTFLFTWFWAFVFWITPPGSVDSLGFVELAAAMANGSVGLTNSCAWTYLLFREQRDEAPSIPINVSPSSGLLATALVKELIRK